MKDKTKTEDKIIKLITNLTNVQRQKIKWIIYLNNSVLIQDLQKE